MTATGAASYSARRAGVAGAALFGAAFFAWIAGARLLDPTDIEWLMKADWVPHQFGWHFFRTEPWHWPPGRVMGYHAPLGTSIGLTDSIPLVAYALKPFNPWLPADVQYLGPWLLVCFLLQGALAARLVSRWSDSSVVQALGGVLCVLLPTLLARVAHAALTAHWLILWALLLATRPVDRRYGVPSWIAIGLAAGLTQPYLAAMVAPLLAAAVLDARGGARARGAGAFAAAIGAMGAGWWLSGLFVLEGEGALTEGGLGYFSMNLLGFVAPADWSRWIPDMALATPGQPYEGFQYLGVGALVAIAVAAALAWRRRDTAPAGRQRVWPAWIVAASLAMTALAVSPVVTLGPYVLLDLTGPWTAPLALFRSSGRFAWPLAYVIVVWAVVTVARHLPARAAHVTLGLAVAVQLVDLSGAHRLRHDAARDPAFFTWPRLFASDRWTAIAPQYRHVVLVPPPQCGESPIPYEPAVRLAATHGLSVNAGVVARADMAARRRYCGDADAAIDAGRLDDDSIYVVSPAAATVLARTAGAAVSCGRIDTVWICTTPAGYARWAGRAAFDP